MKDFKVKNLTLNALFGAVYIVLVLAFNFMSSGEIQFRIAEVLLVLVIFNPKLIYGLLLGTFISNFLPGGFGFVDAIFGTTASLIGILGLILFRKKPLVGLFFPVIANGLIIGFMLHFLAEAPLLLTILTVSFGQAVVLYLLGYPFYRIISKRDDLIELLK